MALRRPSRIFQPSANAYPDRTCLPSPDATGSGKTETLLRLAWTLARTSDTPVFYLDGKGDRETAARFCGLMADAGRTTRVFPNEPFAASAT